MLEGLDKDQRLVNWTGQIVITLQRIEELVDKLPDAIAAAVVECIREDAADDLPIEAIPDDIADGSGGISTV